MAYRSDHEAALARVDTLEHEIAGLVRDNAELRAELAMGDVSRPSPVHRGALWSIGTIGMFVFGVIAGVALTLRAVDPSWRADPRHATVIKHSSAATSQPSPECDQTRRNVPAW